MPTLIPTKESAKIPPGRFDGQICGVHVREQEITENGARKLTLWLEVFISRLADATTRRAFADQTQEIKASYPLPATPASAAGELLARFGAVPTWGSDFDAEAALLGRWVTFVTDFPRDAAGKPTKEFVDVVRASLSPDPNPPSDALIARTPAAPPTPASPWTGARALDRAAR